MRSSALTCAAMERSFASTCLFVRILGVCGCSMPITVKGSYRKKMPLRFGAAARNSYESQTSRYRMK